jgi:hypothetical protein
MSPALIFSAHLPGKDPTGKASLICDKRQSRKGCDAGTLPFKSIVHDFIEAVKHASFLDYFIHSSSQG